MLKPNIAAVPIRGLLIAADADKTVYTARQFAWKVRSLI